MALSDSLVKILNKLSPGAAKAGLGTVLAAAEAATQPATATTAGIVKQGVHVPNAAAAPTKAEFDALLASLRTAGVIASS